ncbi:MAG: 4Fe-4S dicluster domain-containing protein, partial [Erysipelotrichaceae bacterium]|nr:4Fe-4S dicluster domain-containing protein [Erysipelotrichaceae bacterium]
TPPTPVKDILTNANPDVSVASWAIRYVASLENVMVVLSGMSTLGQMEDNTSYMADFQPLSDEEQAVIHHAQETLRNIPQIPCTACRYCTKGCPMQIDIPEIFKAMNTHLIYERTADAKRRYARAVAGGGKASECLHCLQCEGACPQHIEITSWLEKTAELLED